MEHGNLRGRCWWTAHLPVISCTSFPFRRIDVEGTVRALSFAFSSGDVGDSFVRALDRAELAPSGFAPGDFADDVFLRELVARCLRVRGTGACRRACARRGGAAPLRGFPPCPCPERLELPSASPR
jgi:hypothetical protein